MEEQRHAQRLAMTRRANRQSQMVDVEALIEFVFPPSLQHALSTGRLIAFGKFGPLTPDAKLRCGFRGSHVVQPHELNQMCRQFEREDILRIYLHKGQSPFSLSEEHAQDILAQADSHLKVAKGKAQMPQITQEEVRALFAELPMDEDGLICFHQAQDRIARYREEVIKRNKVIFPAVAAATTTQKQRGQQQGSTMATSARRTMLAKTTRGAVAKKKVWAPDVAPATMFQYDKGLNNTEIAVRTTKLLTTRACAIADPADGNQASSLTSNVGLLREPTDWRNSRRDPNIPAFDRWCTVKGMGMGSYVKSAASRTTAKRRSTIANK